MGMAAILFNDAEAFEQSVNIPSTEGSMWNLVKIGQVVLEKKTFTDLCVCVCVCGGGGVGGRGAGGGGGWGRKWWRKILIIPKTFYYFRHIVTFFNFSLIQIYIAVKRSKSTNDHHLNKLVRHWVLDALYYDSAPKFFWFMRRTFSNVFTIYRHGGHLVQLRGTIWRNWQYSFDRRPHVKYG